ncbi:MAG TPA: prolyl oligopeptidase family serine peptidase [Povalibacter sp.]
MRGARASARCLLFLVAWHPLMVQAAGSTVERAASLTSLFPAEQVQALSSVLPADQEVRWKLHLPVDAETPSGLLVFVSPSESGEPPPGWVDVLDEQKLMWIAAEGFGNQHRSNQRVLAALMALTFATRHYSIDPSRTYIAGMSGGGRIASMTITKFPRLFRGAIYIVGVDFWTSAEAASLDSIAANRYVFITGDRDFNRRETQRVFEKYRAAGVERALLMDLPRFGHELPDAERLTQAVQFLDGAAEPKIPRN